MVHSVNMQTTTAGADGCCIAAVAMRRRQDAEAAQQAMDGRFIFCDPTSRCKQPLRVLIEEPTKAEAGQVRRPAKGRLWWSHTILRSAADFRLWFMLRSYEFG